MESEDIPQQALKKQKLINDSKCCICKVFYRKGKVRKQVEFKTRIEAEEFFKKYSLFVQINESLRNKCFSKCRLKKSLVKVPPKSASNTLPSNLPTSESANSSNEPDTKEIEQELVQRFSQTSVEENEKLTNESSLTSEGSLYCPSDESISEN